MYNEEGATISNEKRSDHYIWLCILCIYNCIMSAVEVEASWSLTSQLTQNKYIVKAYTIVELIMYHSCII